MGENMGICPNCGSWVDDGDICMNCGGSGSYSYGHDDDPDEIEINPTYSKRDEYSNKVWNYYMEFKDEDALLLYQFSIGFRQQTFR